MLFGSRARGDFPRSSDIDLAVSGGDAERFRLELEENTSTLLQYDVVNLDRHIQQGLRERIEEEGLRFMKKYENYCSNLAVLATAKNQDLSNEFIISGIIDKFFIQFELGWKILKELLRYEGVAAAVTGSPREIIKEAYKYYPCMEEDVWLSMLSQRNNMAHLYDGESGERTDAGRDREIHSRLSEASGEYFLPIRRGAGYAAVSQCVQPSY